MAHRSTWFSDGMRHADGKPVRNMIDIIMVRRCSVASITDSRSYGGFTTRSDHHPVIADLRLSFPKANKPTASGDLCFVRYNPPSVSSTKEFKSILADRLPNTIGPELLQPDELDSIWKEPVKSNDNTIRELSKAQRALHIQIHSLVDPQQRQLLQSKRVKILHEIRSRLKEEDEQFWKNQAESADAKRPDARSYYNAVRSLRQLRSQQHSQPICLSDSDGNITADIDWNLATFNQYYQSIFYRDDLPLDLRDIIGNDDDTIETTYTVEEVQYAIKKQKLGGAVGQDGISATMLRSAGDFIIPWLTAFFNMIGKTQHCPVDLRCGLLVPIYKKGKPLGFPKSYRPVMLLSVVRKILTSIITRRATDCIDDYVTESQAGFRPGRSTADGIFFTRSMCERALLGDWQYSAALLDFSGAFDTVIRSTALERMDSAGMSISTTATLISNTSARVKLNGKLSEPFDTNIGVVQGDPMSPIMFITYAEGTMKQIREQVPPNPAMPTPFTQYADDTTVHSRNPSSKTII